MEYSVKKVDSFYVYSNFVFGNNLNVFCIFEVIFWCCKILRLRFGKNDCLLIYGMERVKML